MKQYPLEGIVNKKLSIFDTIHAKNHKISASFI